MPDLALNDVTLHYEIEGSGPPLLLLAGMLSDSAAWAGFAPFMTDSYTVIRPDNRTTGRTVPWDAPADCSLMATDAIALMEYLGFERFHVGGHSLGGLLSLEIAHQVPKRVASSTVLASGRIRSPRTAAVFDALLAVRRAPHGEELWLRTLYPWLFGPAFFDDVQNVETALAAALGYPYAQTVDGMAHQVAAFGAFRPRAKPALIACPTLVLYAGQDLMIPPALARPGFAKIPDLTEATIEGAGHSIMWDAPKETARHLLAFLAAHPL